MTFSANFLYRLFYGTLFTIATSWILYAASTVHFQWVFPLAIYIIQLLALQEFFTLTSHENRSSPIRFSYILSFLLFQIGTFSSLEPFELITGYMLFLLFALACFRFKHITGAARNIALEILGSLYITIPLFFSIKLAFIQIVPLPEKQSLTSSVSFWLIATILIAKGGDMAAYFCGKSFGKHLLAPSLSPKKTIEGAIGGIIGSCIGFWTLFILVFQQPNKQAFYLYTFFTILLAIISQLGDFIESLFKRESGVKDSSSYLPGLGGVLDMIDSLIFTIPCAYYLLTFFTRIFTS